MRCIIALLFIIALPIILLIAIPLFILLLPGMVVIVDFFVEFVQIMWLPMLGGLFVGAIFIALSFLRNRNYTRRSRR
ncbi:hypothetical protein C6499_05150 [Candidatus Poribacteria bacterium]|nr:MAG: hypothetical protein C6499_05150 [Candidatus Poribacteria bacterium]